MAEFDQDRGIRNAGSAPLSKPQKPIIPLKEDYVPTADDDEIVHLAYQKKQQDLQKQVEQVQTTGKQAGYTKLDCEDMVNS